MAATPSSVNRDLLLDFFLTFARFEFALKSAGFFQRPRRADPADPQDAHPDWDCFATSVRQTLESDTTAEFREASDYLLMNPPHREVVVDGRLAWDTKPPPPHLPFADRVLLAVRRVRNNLFHGGKFGVVHDADPSRNAQVIRTSAIVLHACLRAFHDVREQFESTAL